MNKELLHEIAASQQLTESSIDVTPVEGGFTAAAKYIIKDGQSSVFVKAIESPPSVTEAVFKTEATIYEALTDLGLTGRYFPEYKGCVKVGSEAALLLEYLSDVSWGGPWDEANIAKLSRSINEVHNVRLTEANIKSIKEVAGNLHTKLEQLNPTSFDNSEKDRFFHAAWQRGDGTFVNSRGTTYFESMEGGSVEKLLEQEALYDEAKPAKLILRDLNFGNLAVAHDRIYFVDPVYADIGNPAHDLVVLGINILRTLPNDDEKPKLSQLVKNTFLQDEAALAHRTKYWVACTSLRVDSSQNDWMDFQQSCAVTALTAWNELYN